MEDALDAWIQSPEYKEFCSPERRQARIKARREAEERAQAAKLLMDSGMFALALSRLIEINLENQRALAAVSSHNGDA